MPRDGELARQRLRAAALELYRDHGYEQTTAAEIAARAGVTERTYFRHFPDKREVLFDGEVALRTILVDAVAAAPAKLGPLASTLRAFAAAVPLFVANRTIAAERAAVIATTPALQERAHAKKAALVEALTDSLVARGEDPSVARTVAQVGMATFELAYSRWAAKPRADLAALLVDASADVERLACGDNQAP